MSRRTQFKSNPQSEGCLCIMKGFYSAMLKKQGIQLSDKDDAVILLMLPPGKDLFWYLHGIDQERGMDFLYRTLMQSR